MVRKVTAERDQRREAFAHALGEGIRNSGLTLETISSRLGREGLKVSVATLSYWQNGQTLPTRGSSLDAVIVLEKILDLPQATLSRHVMTHSGWLPEDAAADSPLAALAAEMNLTMERRTRLLSSQDLLVIDADRRSAHGVVRQFVRVDSEVTEAAVLALAEDSGPPPRVTGVTGCRIDDQRTDEDLGLLVAALHFPRAVRRGEQFWYEYEVDWSAASVERDNHSRLLAQTTGLVAMDVVFRGEPPKRAWYQAQLSTGTALEEPVEVTGDRVQLVLADVAPGEHTLHWRW